MLLKGSLSLSLYIYIYIYIYCPFFILVFFSATFFSNIACVRLSLYIYIYIYIAVYVRVCVCVILNPFFSFHFFFVFSFLLFPSLLSLSYFLLFKHKSCITKVIFPLNSFAKNFFNPCRVRELFSENFQNRGYIQASQLIIYKKKPKQNMIIWSAIV